MNYVLYAIDKLGKVFIYSNKILYCVGYFENGTIHYNSNLSKKFISQSFVKSNPSYNDRKDRNLFSDRYVLIGYISTNYKELFLSNIFDKENKFVVTDVLSSKCELNLFDFYNVENIIRDYKLTNFLN